MANDIVQSLFGVTPDSYQQVQQDRADAQAMRFAQLDPFQQANYAIGRGAYGLAGAVGGALGGQDPELQRISMRQQIAGQIDFGDPQSILAGARELARRGDITGAMQAADVARKQESEMAQRYQRVAAGDASLAEAAKNRQETNAAFNQQAIFDRLNTPPGDATVAPAPVATSITDSVTGTVATPVTPQSAAMGTAMLPVGESAPIPVAAPVPVRARPTLEQDIASLEKQQVALLSLNKIPAAKAQADVLGEQIKDLRSQLKPPTFGVDAERIAKATYGKKYNDLTSEEAALVNKQVNALELSKAPKINVDVRDPTAVAKASLETMNKWEGFLKASGDIETANRYSNLQSSIDLARKGNPNADGASLYNLAKIYDPSGAVQEGDKKSILGNASIPDRVKLLAQQFYSGGSFTPQQRTNMLAIAKEIRDQRNTQLERYRKEYVNVITKFGGSPESIFNPYSINQQPANLSSIITAPASK